MGSNKIYGKVYFGIPLNAPYDDGILVRNKNNPVLQVKDKEGKTVPYHKWEKKHFSKDRGRPIKYNDEQRKEMRKVYAKKYYDKKKAREREKKELEREEFIKRIKII